MADQKKDESMKRTSIKAESKEIFIRNRGASFHDDDYNDNDNDYLSEHSVTKLSETDRLSEHSHKALSDSMPITKGPNNVNTKKAYHSDISTEEATLLMKTPLSDNEATTGINDKFSHNSKSLINELQSIHGTYNQFHAAHEQLINDINKENRKKDDEWKCVVTKLKNDISRLQNDDKKWREIVDKLTGKTQEAMRSFEEIAKNIKQKEEEHKQSLNEIKCAIHQIFSSVNNEKFNIEQSMSIENTLKKFESSLIEKQNDKNKQIELLNQILLDKEKELEKYKNQQDVLKYIQQNIVHKDDDDKMDQIISLQNQLKEKENKLKILESKQENQKTFVLSEDELNQILDDKLSNIMTKNNRLQHEKENIFEGEKEIVKYLKQELSHLIIDTLKSSFIQYNLEKEKQEYQQKQELNDDDDDVESIESEESNSFHHHLIFKQQIDDQMKKALQSNIVQTVTQSKEEIIQRIDEIQEEEKQKQLLEDEYKEQEKYECQIQEIRGKQEQYEQEEEEKDSINELLVLFEAEINTLSTKLDNLLSTINNNCNKMVSFTNGINKYLQTLQSQIISVNNKDQIISLQNQLKEKEDKIKMLDDKLSNISTKNNQFEQFQNDIDDKNHEIITLQTQLKEKKDTIKRLESFDDKLSNIMTKNDQLQKLQTDLEKIQQILSVQQYQQKQQIDDKLKEALQSNILQIVTQSKYHKQNTKTNKRNTYIVPMNYKCFGCESIGKHWITNCPSKNVQQNQD